MAWRVIARVGLAADGNGSHLRNAVENILRQGGLVRTQTGTWESAAMSEANVAATWSATLAALANPPSVNAQPPRRLRHLWLYIDEVPSTAVPSDDANDVEV